MVIMPVAHRRGGRCPSSLAERSQGMRVFGPRMLHERTYVRASRRRGTDLRFGNVFDHFNGSARGGLNLRGSISAHISLARHTVKRAEQNQVRTVAWRGAARSGWLGNRRS